MSTAQDPNLNEDLTEAQLFSRMSRSLREHDYESLDALMDAPLKEEEPEVVPVEEETPAGEEVPEEVPEVPAGEEVKEPVETPAPEVQQEPVPEEDKRSATPPTAELPKEAQEELNRLRQIELKWKSEQGRIPYLQSKLSRLERELRQKEQPPSAASSDGQPASNKELDDVLAQIEDVDPVTAKALRQLRQEALGQVRNTQTILERKEEEELLEREWNKLIQKVPQAAQVFQLPDWEEWKESQTPGLKQLASSSYADDVLVAMDKFAQDMQLRYGTPAQAATPVHQPAPPVVEEKKVEVQQPAPQVPDPKAAAVAEQRSRRLAATTPTSAPAPQPKEEVTDADALLSLYYNEIVKKDHLDKRR